MTFSSRGTSTASPAELVLTESAGHVIAALVFLDSRTAHWAKRDIAFVLFCPTLELHIHSLLTGDQLSMPVVSALKANFCCALGAS